METGNRGVVVAGADFARVGEECRGSWLTERGQKESTVAEPAGTDILRCLGVAVVATDTKRSVTYVNAAAEAILGKTAAECWGHLLTDVVVTEDAAIAGDVAGGGTPRRALRTRLTRFDGEEIPIRGDAARLSNQAGEDIGTLVVFGEDHDRMRAEVAAARELVIDRDVQRLKAMLSSIPARPAPIADEMLAEIRAALYPLQRLMQLLGEHTSRRSDLRTRRLAREAVEQVEQIAAGLDLFVAAVARTSAQRAP